MYYSIIIPTIFERPKWFKDILNCLVIQKTLSSFEIVVVDNNAQENQELCELIRDYQTSITIRLIHEPKNGLHNARHLGSKLAKGDVVIFIDDDVLLEPTWLNQYVDFFEKNNEICAGGKVIPLWEAQPPSWIKNVTKDVFSLLDYGNSLRPLTEKEGINGCNFAIRRKSVFEFGGFNPDGYKDKSMKYLRGDGEYGLIQKIKSRKHKIFYLPNAFLYHRISENRFTISSVKKAYHNQAYSKAFTFLRRRHCTYFSILILFLGSLFLSSCQFIASWFSSNDRSTSKEHFESIKYLSMADYAFHVAINKALRIYINKKDFINEF